MGEAVLRDVAKKRGIEIEVDRQVYRISVEPMPLKPDLAVGPQDIMLGRTPTRGVSGKLMLIGLTDHLCLGPLQLAERYDYNVRSTILLITRVKSTEYPSTILHARFLLLTSLNLRIFWPRTRAILEV